MYEGIERDPAVETARNAVLCRGIRLGAGDVSVTFAVDPSSPDPISQRILGNSSIDEPPIRLAIDMFRRGGRFLDVGAHIGTYSLAAAASRCEVIAVEGSRANAVLVAGAKRANRFDQLHVYNVVATDRDGDVWFVPNGPWGYVSLTQPSGPQEGIVRARGARLENLVWSQGWDRVDFVKLDVEGWEVFALVGLQNLLDRADRPAMLIESNAPLLQRNQADPARLLRILTKIGYQVFLLDPLEPGSLVRVRPDHPQVEAVVHYFACTTMPQALQANWRIVDGYSAQDFVGRFSAACADRNPLSRAYSAGMLARMPSQIRNDPELVGVRAALSLDIDPVVTTSAQQLQSLPVVRRPPKARRGRSVEMGGAPSPWPVFKVLSRKEVTTRFHRSILGVGWAVLTPLLTVAALWAVMSQVFRTPGDDVPYIVYLLSGMTVLWTATQIVQTVGSCLVNSESLLVKIRLSPRIVAFAGTMPTAVNSLVLFVSLIALQLILGVGIPWTMVLAFLLLVTLFVASIGAGMVVASIAIRVTDMLAVLTVIIVVLGYMTPTFYPIEIVPQPWRKLVDANPLTHFLDLFRDLCYNGRLGDARSWAYVVGITVALVVLGSFVFTRSSRWSVVNR